MSKRITAILISVLLLIAILAGCGTTQPSGSTPPTQSSASAAPGNNGSSDFVPMTTAELIAYAKEKQPTITAYLNTLSNPFFADIEKGMQAAAKDLGIPPITIGSSASATDQADVIRWMENWIEMGVDAIVCVPLDPAGTVSVVQEAYDKGIPVITTADDAEDSVRYCFVASDPTELGKRSAEYACINIGGRGKVAIIEGSQNSGNILKVKGMKEVISQYPNIEIVAQIEANWDMQQGMQVAADLIQAHPDIAALICMNDEMALGAVEAAKEAGKLGDIVITSINAMQNGVESIIKGELNCSAQQPTYQYGYISIMQCIRALAGEPAPESGLVPIEGALITQITAQRTIDAAKALGVLD